MPPVSDEEITIENYLSSGLTVGAPDISGPLAVYPVFGGPARTEYVSMARAHSQGFTVKELPGGASVRDLLVSNPGPTAVLLFEGEEVLGAQQNRTFDNSVLVPAGEELKVPVSCVEAGRWDGSRHSESFRPAPQAAHPKLRREKAMQSSRARDRGEEARADQGAVWASVADRSASMGVNSSTGSMHDVYESRRDRLVEMSGGIQLHENQIGAVLQIGNEVKAIDLVSRADVYKDLHLPLIQGYCLDALARPGGGAAGRRDEEVTGFVSVVSGQRILEKDGIGLGRDFRFGSEALVGAGLVAGEELIQLSAFTGETAENPETEVPSHGRIRRPSRRRI